MDTSNKFPNKLLYLNYFVEVVNQHSISKAAQNLYISQPALSKLITKLEKDIGIPLLKRTNKGVFPTTEGERIYNDILAINAIIDSWSSHKDLLDPYGEININITPGIRLHFALNLMIPFNKKYPNLKIFINDTRPPYALQDLHKKQANICITTLQNNVFDVMEQSKIYNISMEELFVDERKIFIGSSHPVAQEESLSIEQLKKIPMAYYSTEKDVQTPYDKFFSTLYYLQSSNEVFELIAHNQAVAILPNTLNQFEPYVKQKQIKTFPVPFPGVNLIAPVYLCYTSKVSNNERILLEYIRENFITALH